MSLARDVIDQLRAALSRTAEVRETINAARSAADEMFLEIQAATAGSSDEKPGEALVRLQQAQVRLDEVLGELDEADAAVQAYIGDLGGDGPAPSAAAPPASTGQGPAPARRPFKPIRTDPTKSAEIRPYVGLDYAVATLWDQAGNQTLGPHSADDDGPAAAASWRPPWRDYPRLRRHVEAHAAARMKPGQNQKFAMYINLPPCSYSDGCKLNVADLVPAGSTLYVHQVLDNGSTRVHIFEGTGRALNG